MPTLSLSKNQGSRAGTCDIYHILLAGAWPVRWRLPPCDLVALYGKVRHVRLRIACVFAQGVTLEHFLRLFHGSPGRDLTIFGNCEIS